MSHTPVAEPITTTAVTVNMLMYIFVNETLCIETKRDLQLTIIVVVMLN